MGVHPVRWLHGGNLVGEPAPANCHECTTWLGPEPCDIYCPTCRSRIDEERRKAAEAQQREAEEHGGLYWAGGWWNGDD